ncbi:MAG: hypothetical protein PWR01_4790, partial [Clostridiales bacterium]|nr:hypothetical protein [Clostridiales bacterium]MDN5283717.1 hypothetical protein [Candidatus Ozemobacter sp.]
MPGSQVYFNLHKLAITLSLIQLFFDSVKLCNH